MRVASLAMDADGVVRGVLQIEPKDGWITYWREPGEAGIPPQITPDPASGAALTTMAYPVPKLIENGDITDIGYDHAVSLPFQLKATDPAAGGKSISPPSSACARISAFPSKRSFQSSAAMPAMTTARNGDCWRRRAKRCPRRHPTISR